VCQLCVGDEVRGGMFCVREPSVREPSVRDEVRGRVRVNDILQKKVIKK